MRGTRAIFGAFGAGMSLAVAASVALLIASSVVAFRGWPDDLRGDAEPQVARLSQDTAPSTATAAVALPRASAPVRATGGRHRGARSPRRTARSGPGPLPPASAAAGGTAGTAPAGQTAAVPPGAPAAGAPRPRATQPVHQVADAVRATTKAAGDAVAPVAPTVGGALESVGAAGAGVVDQVGKAVDGTVDTTLP